MERLPLRVNRRYQKSSDEIKDVVGEVIARSVGSDPADTSLLSVLTRTHDPDSESDRERLRDEIVTMLVAGSETVATTLAWILHEIARHPEVEQELVSELDAVLSMSAVQYDDFDRLPVTDRVIKEALRLHTPTWLLTRRTTPTDPARAVPSAGRSRGRFQSRFTPS